MHGPEASPQPPVPDLQRLLVVDLGFLGDTIHLIPALHELRRHHVHARLDVVTTPVGAQVLEMVPNLGRVWTYPLGNPSPPWWRHLDLQRALRREHYDLSLNFSGADRSLFVAGFAGIPRRLTRTPARGGAWRRWLGGSLLAPPSRDLPVFEQRRQLLAAAGYGLAAPRFDLDPGPGARDWASKRVPAGAVHLSVNASSPFKEWPLTSWIELCRAALEHGLPALVATGSAQARERERLRLLTSAVANPRLLVLDEPLRIPQLAAVVERCALHVGTDSGVTHLAMALGRPTVSLFREYAGLREWAPIGPSHRSLVQPCLCVDRPALEPACARSGSAECLARIQPSAVLQAMRETLEKPAPA